MAEVEKLGGQERDLATPCASRGTDRVFLPHHHAFRVEVAFLAGSRGSKGGTVMRNPEEVQGRNTFTTFPLSTASTGEETEVPPLLGRKLLHHSPGKRSGNEALEAGRR